MAEKKQRDRLVGRTRTGRKIYVGPRSEADRLFARRQNPGRHAHAFTPKS